MDQNELRPSANGDLLRRAATVLRALDQEAGAAPWKVDDDDASDFRIVRGSAIESPGSHHCVDAIEVYDEGEPDELEIRADFALICALRPLAAPLADWLDSEARWCDLRPELDHPYAVAIAHLTIGAELP